MKDTKTTKSIANTVEQACKKKDNQFGYGAWSHHIVSVVRYSKLLAKKLKADQEICILAALLHDYASVLDKKLYPKHHIHGARLAEELLNKHKYPKEKIKIIKLAILNHRGSRKDKRKKVEEKILASADSMAHFDNVDSLLYLAYVKHDMDIDEGKKWVLEKLERSWKKLMPEAKEVVREKYESIKKALD